MRRVNNRFLLTLAIISLLASFIPDATLASSLTATCTDVTFTATGTQSALFPTSGYEVGITVQLIARSSNFVVYVKDYQGNRANVNAPVTNLSVGQTYTAYNAAPGAAVRAGIEPVSSFDTATVRICIGLPSSPTPTNSPTNTRTNTPTNTPTRTATPPPTSTRTATPPPTSTRTATPPPTSTRTATPPRQPTVTPRPTGIYQNPTNTTVPQPTSPPNSNCETLRVNYGASVRVPSSGEFTSSRDYVEMVGKASAYLQADFYDDYNVLRFYTAGRSYINLLNGSHYFARVGGTDGYITQSWVIVTVCRDLTPTATAFPTLTAFPTYDPRPNQTATQQAGNNNLTATAQQNNNNNNNSTATAQMSNNNQTSTAQTSNNQQTATSVQGTYVSGPGTATAQAQQVTRTASAATSQAAEVTGTAFSQAVTSIAGTAVSYRATENAVLQTLTALATKDAATAQAGAAATGTAQAGGGGGAAATRTAQAGGSGGGSVGGADAAGTSTAQAGAGGGANATRTAQAGGGGSGGSGGSGTATALAGGSGGSGSSGSGTATALAGAGGGANATRTAQAGGSGAGTATAQTGGSGAGTATAQTGGGSGTSSPTDGTGGLGDYGTPVSIAIGAPGGTFGSPVPGAGAGAGALNFGTSVAIICTKEPCASAGAALGGASTLLGLIAEYSTAPACSALMFNTDTSIFILRGADVNTGFCGFVNATTSLRYLLRVFSIFLFGFLFYRYILTTTRAVGDV